MHMLKTQVKTVHVTKVVTRFVSTHFFSIIILSFYSKGQHKPASLFLVCQFYTMYAVL